MAIPKIEQRKELTKEELSMPRCDIEKLKEENQQLKELLKECRQELAVWCQDNDCNTSLSIPEEILNLLTRINAAIGESEE